jgi:UDP-N-acetylmuramate dehydrogenase
MQLQEHVPLAPLTTFGIGGPARWFVEADTEATVVEAVEFARERDLPLFVLGGGSNLLVSDEGFPGLVIHIAMRGVEQGEYSPSVGVFSVAAGEDWDTFVCEAVGRGYGGIECLAGIPGTVGGTPVQNVGAYGQEVATVIESVRAFDLACKRFVNLSPEDCGFSYRKSIFNTTAHDRFIVMRVNYRLPYNSKSVVSYPDLIRYFKNWPGHPSLAEVSDAVRAIRREKGMLLVPGDPDCASAGSFFKNPVVQREAFERIAVQFQDKMPNYSAGDGRVKIPAAWLLDQAGFHKGFIAGKAGISSRHTLALINRGGATAREVAEFRDRIIAAVEAKFGIQLEPEPVWVGPS